LFTFCRKLRESREFIALVLTSSSSAMKHRAMPPVGARLSVDDDGDDDDGAGGDRGGGRAALATFMLAMFTLARCRISSTYQTGRQASGYNMRLIDD
jgi:hypothetical protein